MTRLELNDREWAKELAALTVEQIEERFHKVFKREMTPIERVAFFLPYPD